jgi:hypothetical protein
MAITKRYRVARTPLKLTLNLWQLHETRIMDIYIYMSQIIVPISGSMAIYKLLWILMFQKF